jgi:8-oxo-dGTP pyrophosphatase MutT (NUDIX family)
MSLEPQKFFIGVIDFFSILMPGALLTYLLKSAVGPRILGADYGRLGNTEGWAIFLVSSYLLGHFLFFIGSWLDDFAYDPLRTMTKKGQIRRLLDGRNLSPIVLRGLAWICFRKDPDVAVERVLPIKQAYLKRIDAPRSINAFQWCKAKLATEHVDALATVNRFEADSKFFRSFVPVMLVILGMALRYRQWWLSTWSFVAMVLAFLRYMEQRFKSTQQAYWYILTLESSREPAASGTKPPASLSSKDGSILASHGGGVVFRKRGSRTEYLLLQAKSDPGDWVLPKGHIEPDEDSRGCAIREVKEETGVWARIQKELKVSEYVSAAESVRVQFYLMEAVGRGKPEDRLREHRWLPLAEALSLTRHPETQELLSLADQVVKS